MKSKVYDAHFFRLTRTYEESAPIFSAMAENPRVERIIVYEHSSDKGCKRTHVHAYVQYTCSRDTIKNQIKKVVGDVVQTDWAFTNVKYDDFSKQLDAISNSDSSMIRMITYMSKGVLSPMIVKGISEDEVKRAADNWVDYEKAITYHQTEKDIKNINEKKFDSNYTRKDIVEMIVKDLIAKKEDELHFTADDDEAKRQYLSRYTNEEILDQTLKTLWACNIIPGAYKYLDYAMAVRMFFNCKKNPNNIYTNLLHKMDAGMYKI